MSSFSTAEWACEKLIAHGDIVEASPTGADFIQMVLRDVQAPVFVSVMSAPRVELASVPNSFRDPRTEFLLNIPKNAFFSGEVVETAGTIPVGIGGLGDLYTAANEKDFRHYISKEARFILRGLHQHTAVQRIVRINNRTYRVFKHQGEPVTVLALNEYDLTADVIRSGIEKFGCPNFILTSNPNSRVTPEAVSAARSAGTGILAWRQLLGALNN